MTKQKYTALTVLCACIFGFYLSSEAQEKTNIKLTQDTAKTKVTDCDGEPWRLWRGSFA